MKPAHKSNAGQIVNEDKAVKVLSDYIKQAKAAEDEFLKKPKTFDEWLDEDYYKASGNTMFTRRLMWDESEIEAARLAWEEARKGEPK